jgi:two-component system phosphate regulon sensor histidine kinase PhoR
MALVASGSKNSFARLRRSILTSQLLISVVLLAFSVVVFAVDHDAFQDPMLYGAVLLAFVVTGVAMMVPWTDSSKKLSALLPLVDIVAIVAMREAQPQLGAGLFLVFPVIWLARNYSLPGAVAGAALSTVALIGARLMRVDSPLVIADFPGLLLLPLTLAFIATTTYATSRRAKSQRVLLRDQAALVESAMRRARTQERMIDEVLNTVEFGVIAFDPDGRVKLKNDSYRRSLAAFGTDSSATDHRVIYRGDRVTPYATEDRPQSLALRGQMFESVVFWVGEPGARRGAFSATSRAVATPAGQPDGCVIVVRDVTAELEAVRAREELSASVTHELRTPLTSILGYLDLAVDAPELSDSTRRMVSVAARNSERMLALVTDLLSAAAGGSNELPLTLVRCDVALITRQAIEDAGTAAAARGITIRSYLEPTAITSADPRRVRQVLDNLLSNAVKYNSEGGSIAVATTTTGSEVRVDVSDSGEGISEGEIEHLFDRFYRSETAVRSAVVGTGLGLAISRDIARGHGGELTVSSEPGDGSTFTLVLPVTSVAPAGESLLARGSG